jgi:uncharacterized protein
MVLYLDTSALVKRYVREDRSDEILSRWRSAAQVVTSSVAYAEILAALYRKRREGQVGDVLIQDILDSFHRDWECFIRVEVNNQLSAAVERVIRRHPLRGFDGIHLASALVVRERLPEDFLFACFDDRLLAAARSEGLATFPEN